MVNHDLGRGTEFPCPVPMVPAPRDSFQIYPAHSTMLLHAPILKNFSIAHCNSDKFLVELSAHELCFPSGKPGQRGPCNRGNNRNSLNERAEALFVRTLCPHDRGRARPQKC